MSFTVFMPTKWIFGTGALDELGKQTLPGKRALLVTSSGRSAKKSGALDRVQARLLHESSRVILLWLWAAAV